MLLIVLLRISFVLVNKLCLELVNKVLADFFARVAFSNYIVFDFKWVFHLFWSDRFFHRFCFLFFIRVSFSIFYCFCFFSRGFNWSFRLYRLCDVSFFSLRRICSRLFFLSFGSFCSTSTFSTVLASSASISACSFASSAFFPQEWISPCFLL